MVCVADIALSLVYGKQVVRCIRIPHNAILPLFGQLLIHFVYVLHRLKKMTLAVRIANMLAPTVSSGSCELPVCT